MAEACLVHNQSDSSIEITKNSKGFNFSIKSYGTTVEEIKTKLNALMTAAKEITTKETEGQ